MHYDFPRAVKSGDICVTFSPIYIRILFSCLRHNLKFLELTYDVLIFFVKCEKCRFNSLAGCMITLLQRWQIASESYGSSLFGTLTFIISYGNEMRGHFILKWKHVRIETCTFRPPDVMFCCFVSSIGLDFHLCHVKFIFLSFIEFSYLTKHVTCHMPQSIKIFFLVTV